MSNSRSLDQEKRAIKVFQQKNPGKLPESPQDWASVHRIAYGTSFDDLPNELKTNVDRSIFEGMGGVSSGQPAAPAQPPNLGQLGGQVDQASARVGELGSGNASMRVLQEAIKAKTGVAEAPLGKSKIFEQAGLTGFSTLGASLSSRLKEMEIDRTEFANILGGAADIYEQEIFAAQQNYNNLFEKYKIKANELQKIDEAATVQKNKVELVNLQSDLRIKEARLKGDIETPDTGRVTSTGQINEVTFNNRTINLDSVATPSLNNINNQASGISVNGQNGLVIGAIETSTYRTAEQQKALFDAGKTPIDGTTRTSKHQQGLAIDLFPDQAYIEQMRPIMESNGWFQTAGDDDLGHFEYQGTSDKFSDDIAFGFNEKIDINRLPDLGGKQITNKTARQGNLPFGVTDKQADWIIAHRAGNVQFQQLKSADLEKLNDLIELREDIDEIREIKKDVNTGPVASRAGRVQRAIGFEDEDFNQLEVKTGKQLAEFIKEISGAAVSVDEAKRLSRLVPNVEMQDDLFVTALNDLEDGLDGLIQAKLTQYDLFDEDELLTSVRGADQTAGQTIEKDGMTFIENEDGSLTRTK